MLIFVPQQLAFPTDGLRYQENEQKYVIPVSGRELEVCEVRFGFIPNHDNAAFRVRRRYRLTKGGHPQLFLIHYFRGQSIPIVPSLNQPLRAYPLRQPNEPAVYVLGEKMGQKVPVAPGPGPMGGVPTPGGDGRGPLPPGAIGGMGMNFGMGMGANPQALLAQQNSAMEALERRTQRERERTANMAAQQRHAPRVEDDDSADEADMISSRTLALARYRRNHEFMNEVFMYAGFGNLKDIPPPKSPYSNFKKDDLEAKITKLNSEIEELQAKAATRREAREAEELADVSMDGLGYGEEITV